MPEYLVTTYHTVSRVLRVRADTELEAYHEARDAPLEDLPKSCRDYGPDVDGGISREDYPALYQELLDRREVDSDDEWIPGMESLVKLDPTSLKSLGRAYVECPTAHPHWVDEIIKPFAKAIGERFPNRDVQVIGPFGIGARVHVRFVRKGASSDDPSAHLSITFCPVDLSQGRIGYVDYEKIARDYKPGTVGFMSGLQYAEVPFRDDITADDAIILLKGDRDPGEPGATPENAPVPGVPPVAEPPE